MGRTIADHPAPAAPSHYLWSFPGSPVKVQLGLDVVEHLQRQQHKGEISGEQGLLLGRVLGPTTEISDFIAIPGSEPPDPNVIAALSPGLPGESSRVGYYRIQHGGSLQLNENDLSLAAAAIPDPQQVFLLIQLRDSGPANAAFFFWDDGRIGDFPFLEFPFDASLLAARHRIEPVQPKALAKPAAVDSAHSSDRQAPRSRTAFKTVFLVLAIGLVISILPSVIALAGKLFPKKASPISIIAPTESPGPVSLGLQAERQRGDLKLTWDRASTVIGSATSGVLSIQDGASKREIPLDSTLVRAGSLLYSPTTDQVQMQLTVAGPEHTATETVMVILPKVGPPQIQPTHVKTANVKPRNAKNVPTPAAPPTASKSTSESAASESRPLPPKLFNAPSRPVDRQPVSSPVALGEAPVLHPGFTPNATLPLSVIANFAPGPPPVPGNPAPGNPTSGNVASGKPAPVTLPTNSRQPVAVAPESPQRAAEYHPAEAIRQEVPRIPATVPKPKIYSAVSVEVTISIDKTGKAVKVTPVPKKGANPVLVMAAVEAARRWTFQPARIGDQPLASEITIGFNFQPTH